MTATGTAHGSYLVRVDELRRGDHVVTMGRVVEVVSTVTHPDFPTALLIEVRALPTGRPVSTLMPRDWQLVALRLQRMLKLRCTTCQRALPTVVDMAVNRGPGTMICGPCQAKPRWLPRLR